MPTPPTFAVGQVLTAAQMNSIGLWKVKSQSIGSGSGTVVVPNAFSADFDSYQIVVSGGALAAGDYGINMRLGSTITGYYYTGTYLTYGNASSWIGAGNAAEWGAVGIATTNSLMANIFVANPFLTKNSFFVADYTYNNPAGGRAQMSGYLANNTSYSSFTLFINASTFTSGDITVYGYRK